MAGFVSIRSRGTIRLNAEIMYALGLACRHGSLATSKIVVSISLGFSIGIELSRTAKRPYEKKPRTI